MWGNSLWSRRMTSLDSCTVGWSKFGNGETGGVSALAFFAGLTGSAGNTDTGERDLFMLPRHGSLSLIAGVRESGKAVEEQTEVRNKRRSAERKTRRIERRYPPVLSISTWRVCLTSHRWSLSAGWWIDEVSSKRRRPGMVTCVRAFLGFRPRRMRVEDHQVGDGPWITVYSV